MTGRFHKLLDQGRLQGVLMVPTRIADLLLERGRAEFVLRSDGETETRALLLREPYPDDDCVTLVGPADIRVEEVEALSGFSFFPSLGKVRELIAHGVFSRG